MSMGYAAVFDIIRDLMMRMESKGRYDLEGIVLIDEIETHLHVELQKKNPADSVGAIPTATIHPNHPLSLRLKFGAKLRGVRSGESRFGGKRPHSTYSYEGIVEGHSRSTPSPRSFRDKFDAYRRLVQKPTPDGIRAPSWRSLELYLDAVPDYLAPDFLKNISA